MRCTVEKFGQEYVDRGKIFTAVPLESCEDTCCLAMQRIEKQPKVVRCYVTAEKFLFYSASGPLITALFASPIALDFPNPVYQEPHCVYGP